MCRDIFLGFFNKHSVPKKRSLEPGMLHLVHFCLSFRVWLHFTSRDDCLQALRNTGRRLPLVAICAAWRADQVLYCSCTIGIYNDEAVLCVFTQDYRSLLSAKRDRGIPRSTVDLSSSVRCCRCFSDRNP